MAKYRQSFLREVKRFDECNRQPGSPSATEIGLKQFFDWESTGKKPDVPDRYFVHLLDGKRWWEWTLNEYADSYFDMTDWSGWHALALDFLEDVQGFKQLRNRCGQSPLSPAEVLAKIEANEPVTRIGAGI